MTFIELLTIWGLELELDVSVMPSAINGVASATALLMAFNGIMLTASYSFLKIQPSDIKERVYWTMSCASLALGLIGWAYVNYASSGDSENALKLMLSGLVITVGLSTTFSTRIFSEHDKHSNNGYLDYA
jgi:uncharacterized membrane protein YfcA